MELKMSLMKLINIKNKNKSENKKIKNKHLRFLISEYEKGNILKIENDRKNK